MTEAFSWLVTTFGVGAAVGTAAAGPAIEGGSTAWGFAVAGVSGFAALFVLLATAKVLAVPGRTTSITGSSESDRKGPVEPGFSAEHQA